MNGAPVMMMGPPSSNDDGMLTMLIAFVAIAAAGVGFYLWQSSDDDDQSDTKETKKETKKEQEPDILTFFEKEAGQGGSPNDNIGDCGKYTTLADLAKACKEDAKCMGFSEYNGKPWCMKSTKGKQSLSDHVFYWKK